MEEEKKKGNRRRATLENNLTSSIVILALEDKEKYLREIERELDMFESKKVKDKNRRDKEGTSKTNISNELINLTYEKILIRTHKKNKVYYKVDWDEICSHFVRHVSALIKKRYGEDPFLLITKYRKNKYFIILLKISFNSNFELFKAKRKRLKTIGEIFEETIYEMVYSSPPHESTNEKQLSRNKELKEFTEFSKIIYNFLVGDNADTIGSFFDEIGLSTKHFLKGKTSKKNK